jgi:radical SAM superfamily enzyme YgiQ (UPF0313 family)
VTIIIVIIFFETIIVKITERKIMKKILILLTLVLFTGSAYAGSCPMMAKNLDSKIEEASKMRDAGMKAHEAGDHSKSEELLNKAMELFKS